MPIGKPKTTIEDKVRWMIRNWRLWYGVLSPGDRLTLYKPRTKKQEAYRMVVHGLKKDGLYAKRTMPCDMNVNELVRRAIPRFRAMAGLGMVDAFLKAR